MGSCSTVAGHGRVYMVPLQDLDVVRLEQPLHGPNWKVVGYIGLGVAIAAPVFHRAGVGDAGRGDVLTFRMCGWRMWPRLAAPASAWVIARGRLGARWRAW